MSMPRCVATGTALSVSLCIVYGLSMGDFDLVMCIISHLEGLKVICRQSRCPVPDSARISRNVCGPGFFVVTNVVSVSNTSSISI